VARGYVVSIPLSKSAKYDLVVELDGKLSRVQCKYAGYGRRTGLYVSGGNRSAGNRRIKYEVLDFDLLYVLCESGGTYCIPMNQVQGRITLNLGRDSKRSRWEPYRLSAGEIRSPVEESTGEPLPKSAKPEERWRRRAKHRSARSSGEGVET
jgi:hypothetical protein